MAVLGWMELSDEDRPNERIWLDDTALGEHFERMQERYRSGSGGSSSSEWESIPSLEQNELTAAFRR